MRVFVRVSCAVRHVRVAEGQGDQGQGGMTVCRGGAGWRALASHARHPRGVRPGGIFKKRQCFNGMRMATGATTNEAI